MGGTIGPNSWTFVVQRGEDMEDTVESAIERMRTTWSLASKIMDANGDLKMSYVYDLAIIVDAVLMGKFVSTTCECGRSLGRGMCGICDNDD